MKFYNLQVEVIEIFKNNCKTTNHAIYNAKYREGLKI